MYKRFFSIFTLIFFPTIAKKQYSFSKIDTSILYKIEDGNYCLRASIYTFFIYSSTKNTNIYEMKIYNISKSNQIYIFFKKRCDDKKKCYYNCMKGRLFVFDGY